MSWRLAIAVLVMTCFGCTTNPPRATGVRQEMPRDLWQRNMTIIDKSVEFWRGRVGTAPYSPDELTNAIAFFEDLTQLRGRTNLTFIGPIPDDDLARASREWKPGTSCTTGA